MMNARKPKGFSYSKRFLVFFLLLFSLTLLGFGTDYYVSNAGDDEATGLIGFPWQTTAKVNGESFSAGDVIYFNKGDTWAEQLTIPSSGESENHITIGAYGTGAAPIIDGGSARSYCINTNSKNYLTFDGIHCKSGTSHNIYIPMSDFVTVQNCTSELGGSGGLYAGDDNDTIIIDGNTFSSNVNGINLSTGLTSSVVSDNTIHSNTAQGVYTSSGVTIENNVIYSNGTSASLDHGVYADTDADDVIMRYNHVYDNASIGLLSSGDDTQMYYNISHHNTKGIQTSGGTGHKYFNNVCYANGSGNVGHGISIQGSATVAEIKNNILVANYGAVDLYTGQINIGASATLTASDYNIIYGDGTASQDLCTDEAGSPKYTFAEWQGAGYDANSIEDDPEFVNAGGSFALDTDYLLESDSPAIDAGVDVGLSTDYFENDVHAGTVEDIGAHEYPLGGGGETIYYVDKTTGSDDDSGLTAALAWETVAKVNGESFSAGDYILFKRDEEWREQLTIPDSGSDGSPIVFGAYGSGEQPIINGADLVETWTAAEGGAWQTADDRTINSYNSAGTRNYRSTLPANTSSFSGTKIRLTMAASGGNAVITGTSIGVMATDDVFDPAPTRITWDTGSAGTTVLDGVPKVSDEIDFTFTKTNRHGMHVYYLQRQYSGFATAGGLGAYYNDTAIDDTLTQDPEYSSTTTQCYWDKIEVYVGLPDVWQAACTTEPNQVFFDGVRGTLQASAAACTSAGDWFWAADVLYVYHTQDPDGDIVIEAQARTYCILDDGHDYITIQDLNLKNADKNLQLTNVCTNWVIDNVTSNYAYYSGIRAIDGGSGIGNNITVQNCTVTYTGGSGIHMGAVSDSLIKNNIAHHNVQFDDTVITTELAGIRFVGGGAGDDNIVELNTCYSNGVEGGGNTGFGIYMDTVGDGNIVRYNLIYGNKDRGGISFTDGTNGEIYYNIIYGETDDTEYYYGNGINLEHEISGFHVYNNTVYNCSRGIVMNGWSEAGKMVNNLIRNNICESCTVALRASGGGENDGTNGSGNVYEYNCFGAEGADFIKWGAATPDTYDVWETAYGATTNSVEADPLMTDPGSDVFTLQFGSPCINRGAHVGLFLDYLGLPVPIGHCPDIGAYEHKNGGRIF